MSSVDTKDPQGVEVNSGNGLAPSTRAGPLSICSVFGGKGGVLISYCCRNKLPPLVA